jgi:hypothetical protein
LKFVLLSGDTVLVKRSAGRILEVPEEAVVLGTLFGCLYYRLVNQKSEGSSLSEGGGRPWYWDESEVVTGGLSLIGDGKGMGIELPLLNRFCCSASGGLRVIYSGGAVVRSDLEIFDGSSSIGVIAQGTVITKENVLERRVNSCGVIRYRIKHEPIGEGWISSRIRGGKEELIVQSVEQANLPSKLPEVEVEPSALSPPVQIQYFFPEDAALCWLKTYELVTKVNCDDLEHDIYHIKDIEEFEWLLQRGTIHNFTAFDSDSRLASAVSMVSDQLAVTGAMDAGLLDIASSVGHAVSIHSDGFHGSRNPAADLYEQQAPIQAATSAFSDLTAAHEMPPIKAILARVAMLRALNR